MITYVVSDIFTSPARVLVNTVNTVGVMGKGIAKDFKIIYPEMFAKYQKLCERKQFNVGQLWLYKTNHKWILNFPTKKHWRNPSKPEYVEAGLKKFVKTYAEKGITTISFPMLGCGNGGLNWEKIVKPMMEYYLNKLPIEVFIHLYKKDPFAPEHKNIKMIRDWLRSEPESLSFIEVWEDLVEMISSNSRFKTLEKSETFDVEIVDDPELGIFLNTSKLQHFIHYEQLLDLWQHLRGFGFCMDHTMPSGLEIYTDYLIAILSNLPYLKPVLLSKRYNAVDDLEIGLQYFPKTDYPSIELTEPTMEVHRYEL